jgi:lipopolysaccharide transport system ATP-binding protein
LGEPVAIRGIDIHKAFPIVSSGGAWRVILGLQGAREWFSALKGVSLSVPKGEILGVLGRNGAGKSTLLRVLAGVYAPSVGKVSVTGNVAALFELGGLGTRFITGREYADRLLRFQGIRGKRLKELIEEVRDFSELGEFFDRKIYTYSSGMAARLYFSVATAVRKDVFLIDELLSVGDEHFQAKCWRRIRDLLGDGASGVLVTHDWSAVIKLCKNSMVLERGVVAFSGRSDKVVAEYLQLPPPDTTYARFVDLPEMLVCESGKDLSISLPIEVIQPCDLEFAFSIEMLRLGFGWEIVLLSKFHALSCGKSRGPVAIKVHIHQLPLAPGRYSLNLFIRRRSPDGSYQACDARTWTMGNGLTLAVEGNDACDTIARIPLQWRAIEGAHASH